jgi:hypothetical protein
MVYYLGQATGIDYFSDLSLRTWAEDKVYGPLGEGIMRSMSRLLFLCFPYGFSFLLRYCLFLARRGE